MNFLAGLSVTGSLLNKPMRMEIDHQSYEGTWVLGLANPIGAILLKDPARFNWQEVTKVAHYWIDAKANLKSTVR